MPKSHRLYPAEFRQRIIELVRKGRTPEELGREFEPSAQAIRNWMYEQTSGIGDRTVPSGLTIDQGVLSHYPPRGRCRGDLESSSPSPEPGQLHFGHSRHIRAGSTRINSPKTLGYHRR